MIERDIIIVGGGPAGSTAAWQLARYGRECLVLDRETFPRDKLCAGWITPDALLDLELDPATYPHRFLTFDTLSVTLAGFHVDRHMPQHSIRRFEFDAWLLDRSGAERQTHAVRKVDRVDDGFVIDGTYRCRYLIGAGGTSCPVYRALFCSSDRRCKALQAVALELEYEFDWRDPTCHLWFFTDSLRGYSWYVPKAERYLNIGVGGMAEKLNQRGDHIHRHWDRLVARLLDADLIDAPPAEPSGYSYFLQNDPTPLREGNAFVVGDAAGLATRDLCEGMGPAIRSGLQVAQTIDDRPRSAVIRPWSIESPLVHNALEWRLHGFPKRNAGDSFAYGSARAGPT